MNTRELKTIGEFITGINVDECIKDIHAAEQTIDKCMVELSQKYNITVNNVELYGIREFNRIAPVGYGTTLRFTI